MISMEKLLNHMAWSNQQIIGQLAKMPDQALTAYVINPNWHVAEILRHTLSSADWYGFRLGGVEPSDFDAPSTIQDVVDLLPLARRFDTILIDAASQPEGWVYREVDGKTIKRARSTVLSQAVHHATEHRAQLVAALDLRGFGSIDLDNYDLWAYCDVTGE